MSSFTWLVTMRRSMPSDEHDPLDRLARVHGKRKDLRVLGGNFNLPNNFHGRLFPAHYTL